jgi:hypothetical protein
MLLLLLRMRANEKPFHIDQEDDSCKDKCHGIFLPVMTAEHFVY